MSDAHLVTLRVTGRPAAYSTAGEKLWKHAVRDAVVASGVQPQNARFAVRIDFRLGVSHSVNEVWDLDNLVKPTLDAMEGVFGTRAIKGPVQTADDRVDRLQAVKRQPRTGEEPGATIDVWIICPEKPAV